MAERVGFEPTERFPVHSISSAANSTTLAPLQMRMLTDEVRMMIAPTLRPKPAIHNPGLAIEDNPKSAFRNLKSNGGEGGI